MLTLAIALIASVAAGAGESPAQYGYLTAGELDRRCLSTAAADATYCFAYVAAVHDSVRSYELWLDMQEFCAPPATAQAELRSIFTDYMRTHPGERTAQAASVVVVSLKQRYACAIGTAPQPVPVRP